MFTKKPVQIAENIGTLKLVSETAFEIHIRFYERRHAAP